MTVENKSSINSILLVDDDESTRKTFSLIFTGKGLQIDTAANGREALDKIRRGFFSVILLDINLPDMKGMELIAPVKNKLPDATILILTAHASLESAICALNRGASAYFTKPIDVDLLVASVKEAIEKQRLIIEKKTAENNLKKANRALRMVSQINEAIARAENEVELLEHTDRIIIDTGGYGATWAGYISGNNQVQPVTWAGSEEKLVKATTAALSDSPLLTTLLEGKPYVTGDIRLDNLCGKMGGLFSEFSSMIIVPIVIENRACGSFQIFSHEINSFDDDDVGLFRELADDLAFGIKSLRTRAQLDHQRNALETVYKIAMDNGASCESLCDVVALNIADLFNVKSVIARISTNCRMRTSKLANSSITHENKNCLENLCELCCQSKDIVKLIGNLTDQYPQCRDCLGHDIHSLLGLPLYSGENRIGTICLLDDKERSFSDEEIHLLEIFARYLIHEIEREEMEIELRQAQEMKILGQLASGVAHEVRNPLNAIQAIMEALMQDLGDKTEYQPYLEHIKKQVKRLASLMSDLLELGKPKAHFKLQPEICVNFFSHAINIWKENSSFGNHDIRLVYPEEAEICRINIDSAKLQQVVSNILDNACQNSPEKELINIIVDPPLDNFIKIKFVDNGSGIKEEYLQHIFEPFFTMRKRGTGLGLTVVKHIIEVHGGFVAVYNNKPHRGLTVEVSVPVIVQVKN